MSGLTYVYQITSHGVGNVESTRSVPSNSLTFIMPTTLATKKLMVTRPNKDRVEIEWDVEPNGGNGGIYRLYRWVQGIDSDYTLYKEYNLWENPFVDKFLVEPTPASMNNKHIWYYMVHEDLSGISARVQDFVYVTERDPNAASPVTLRGIRWNNDELESVLQGKPEFTIAVFGVKEDGSTNALGHIRIKPDKGNKSLGNGMWENMTYDNRYLTEFDQRTKWYQRLAFYVVEEDWFRSGSFEAKGEYNDKNLTEAIPYLKALSAISSFKYTIPSEGNRCGYAYLNYCDPINTSKPCNGEGTVTLFFGGPQQ